VYMEIAKRNKPTYSRLFFLMLAGGAFLYLTRQPISTAILCTVLMAIGIYVLEKYPVVGEKIMKYGFLATFILCVLFIYNIVQEMFSFIIVDMLNESIELNGRTQIWEQVMNYIYKRPLIGYGYSSGIRFDVWQEYNTSTHNFYLFLFFSSGLVGLGLFFGAIYSIHKKVLKKINFRIVRYILLTLIVINIECITEVCCFNAMYFSVLALSSNVEYILPKKERLKANFDMDLNLME
ncbi:MAG: O-antigen ligase family protein, partial [Clostridia bacterium]|nr:O-antigen ligase family protein [Clostridia bacterium]